MVLVLGAADLRGVDLAVAVEAGSRPIAILNGTQCGHGWGDDGADSPEAPVVSLSPTP